MTPDEVRAFWNELRSSRNQQILENTKSPDQQVRNQAWKEAVMISLLNHIVTEYLDTFKAQG